MKTIAVYDPERGALVAQSTPDNDVIDGQWRYSDRNKIDIAGSAYLKLLALFVGGGIGFMFLLSVAQGLVTGKW